MKTRLALFAAVFAGACTLPWTAMPADPETRPDTPLCDFTITDTSAWKNMMPGPGGPSGNVVVMVELEDDGVSRRFEPQGVSEDGTLTLEIVEWGPDAGLGRIVYRDKGLSPERVEIRCGGEILTTIDEVMKVY